MSVDADQIGKLRTAGRRTRSAVTAGSDLKRRLVGALVLVGSFAAICAPTMARAYIYSCSGWAEGSSGSRMEAVIIPSQINGVRADWTPPHAGAGPMSLQLTYEVRNARLSALRRAWIEGEVAPDAFEINGSGYIKIEADARSSWRVTWRAEQDGLFHPEQSAASPYGQVLITSNHPNYPGEARVHPERLQMLENAQSVRIAAYGRKGELFDQHSFDLSGRQDRDQLFRLAYARAAEAVEHGPHACQVAGSTCECGG